VTVALAITNTSSIILATSGGKRAHVKVSRNWGPGGSLGLYKVRALERPKAQISFREILPVFTAKSTLFISLSVHVLDILNEMPTL
jgi:hypothetical protein